jgi:hypothetical protein
MLKRLWCFLVHSRHRVLTPWGIHHYDGECMKCGRRFDVYD